MKQISAKPILLTATVFAYGPLVPVDCDGLPAEVEPLANLASVGGTTQRKTRRALAGRMASPKASAQICLSAANHPAADSLQ